MRCAYHPEVDAVSACVNCGRLICAECKTVLGGKIYCNPCANKLFTGTSIPHKPTRPNWFQRHLNWTVVLVGVPVSCAAGAVCSLLAWLIDPYGLYITDEALRGLGFLVGTVAMFPVAGWALKKKRRSLWWLLILFVPFGWIVFLCLENRSELIDIKNGVITKIKSGEDGTD